MTIKSLTLDDINKAVVAAQYYVFPGTTMTVCCLTMLHGYTVLGKSACIDPDNFDEAMGRSLANQDAVQNVWELEAYLAMYKNAKGEDPVFMASAINDPIPVLTPEPEPVPTDPPVSPPSDPLPVDPVPVDPPSPVEPTPSDPVPVDPLPVEPAPAPDPAPVVEDPAPPVVTDPPPVDPPVETPPVPDPAPDPTPVDPPVVDPVPAPAPADPAPADPAPPADAPRAMTVDKPIAELTPDELVVEEAAVVAAEADLTTRTAEEDLREAEFAAAHPGNPAVPPNAAS